MLIVAGRDHAMLLESAGAGTDFVLDPADPVEIRLRLRRIIRSDPVDHVVHFKDLALNTATYQATVAGRPVDLTYMEYELLRFFVEHREGCGAASSSSPRSGVTTTTAERGRSTSTFGGCDQAGRGAGQLDHDRPVGGLPIRVNRRLPRGRSRSRG